jgi:hypothetical protein
LHSKVGEGGKGGYVKRKTNPFLQEVYEKHVKTNEEFVSTSPLKFRI